MVGTIENTTIKGKQAMTVRTLTALALATFFTVVLVSAYVLTTIGQAGIYKVLNTLAGL